VQVELHGWKPGRASLTVIKDEERSSNACRAGIHAHWSASYWVREEDAEDRYKKKKKKRKRRKYSETRQPGTGERPLAGKRKPSLRAAYWNLNRELVEAGRQPKKAEFDSREKQIRVS